MQSLTDHQTAVFLQIQDFLDGRDQRLILTGAAGTGKTTLLTHVMKYATNKKRMRVLVCAPTHTAASEISKRINKQASTLQSFLKLKPKYDEDGNKEFLPTDETGNNEYNLIIIDESSMINVNLFGILEEYITCKVIYVGDDHQLPPVKESSSLVFCNDFQRVELLEQLRTDIFSDIYSDFRRFVETGIFPNVPNHLRITDNIDQTIVDIFRENPGMKILAHRNSQVDEYNGLIKDALFGDGEYSVGERMRFCNFHEINYTSFYTNFEFIITRTSLTRKDHPWGNFWVWSLGFEHEGREWTIDVISQKSRRKWKTKYSSEKKNLMKLKKYKRDWKKYYKLISKFDAPIKRAYGSTVYSAQGQTLFGVIVDVEDIMHTARENNRECIYTAISRPSNLIWFIM